MAGINVKTDVRGIKEMETILVNLSRKIKGRERLHERWAIQAYNWIMRNFATNGGLVGGWKALSPNTVAGRRKGSGQILQDTGGLKASFVPRWNDKQASVGTPLKIAEYHEYGTGPYEIRPKNKQFLRFMMATQSGVKSKVLKSGKTISLPFAKGGYVFAKVVHHPGLPVRRMLPTASDPVLMQALIKAGEEYLKKESEGG